MAHMEPVHRQVLEAACGVARLDWTFEIRAVVNAVRHLNARTVRTHVASRCCVNAPSNHQSRHPYFTAVRRGVYRVEPLYRATAVRGGRRTKASQDIILDSIDSGVDSTLIVESLAMTPTERLETMRRALLSLDGARGA